MEGVGGPQICYEGTIESSQVIEMLRNVEFRGAYDSQGKPLKPYEFATFSLVTVYPPTRPTDYPLLMHNLAPQPLFTAQPTIYKANTDVMVEVNKFLTSLGKQINTLGFEGIQYHWKDRGTFHVLPPLVELHNYPLTQGKIDTNELAKRFEGVFVRDAKGNLHDLSTGLLKNFFVDSESHVRYLEVFNNNVELINYGLRFNGECPFYIICDGSHRMDYALEHLNKPINVILVEGAKLPYYALPMPFMPITRLTSKASESMYPRLERDKVHILHDLIRKVLHYDWKKGGLHVSKLRSGPKIH